MSWLASKAKQPPDEKTRYETSEEVAARDSGEHRACPEQPVRLDSLPRYPLNSVRCAKLLPASCRQLQASRLRSPSRSRC